MSKTNEAKLYKLLKDNLKNVHFTRIESHTEQGIPDVNACYNGKEVWIELKANLHKDLGLSKYQIVWIRKRTMHGGKVFIMNRPLLDKTLRIYSGMSLVRYPCISDNVQPTVVLGPRIDWNLVQEALFTDKEPSSLSHKPRTS